MERMKRDMLKEMSPHLKTLKFYCILSSVWLGLLFCYPSYTGRLWKNRSNTSVPIPGLNCLPHDKSSCCVKTPLDLKYLSSFFFFLCLCCVVFFILSNTLSLFCSGLGCGLLKKSHATHVSFSFSKMSWSRKKCFRIQVCQEE